MLSLICLANLILGIMNSLNQARYGWLNLLCEQCSPMHWDVSTA